MAFVVCQGCQRHVRAAESACPFCTTAMVASSTGNESALPAGRVTRAHVAGLVVGAVAVSSVLFGTACPAYGGPALDRDSATSGDSGSGNNDAR